MAGIPAVVQILLKLLFMMEFVSIAILELILILLYIIIHDFI